MADYAEGSYYQVLPGGMRATPPQVREDRRSIPRPITPETREWLRQVLEGMDDHGGVTTREESFSVWTSHTVVLNAANPVQIDVPMLKGRRAVLLTNTDAANVIWYGPQSSVRANAGGYLAFLGGAVSLPLSESAHIWAIGAAGAPVISVLQFASPVKR